MKLGLRNREALMQISPALVDELENMMATIGQTMTREHDAEGRHTDIHARSIITNKIESHRDPSALTPGGFIPEESGHQWLLGPWLFDEIGNDIHRAGLRPPDMAAGTYNDFAPTGIDNAVLVELTPTGSIDITGIRIFGRYKRILVLGNKGGSGNLITLKHNNTGSVLTNRFGLPGDADLSLDTGQYCWLYYDVGSEVWRAIVTGHTSGGSGALVSDVKKASLSLTAAQMDTLNATPIQIVAAPGSGKIAIPLGIEWAVNKLNNTTWTAAPSFQIIHQGQTTSLATSAGISLSSGSSGYIIGATFQTTWQYAVGTNVANTALQVRFSADTNRGAGPPQADANAIVTIPYIIISAP